MSQRSPESIESRHYHLIGLAEQSRKRVLFWMAMTAGNMVGTIASAYYISERYYPLMNTMEEIMQGPWEKLDPITQTGLTASLGVAGFLLAGTACVGAAAYQTYQHLRYNREADRLLQAMEDQSKHPPSLGSY